MGAALHGPKERDMDKPRDMVRETCITLGILSPGQIARLKAAGPDFHDDDINSVLA